MAIGVTNTFMIEPQAAKNRLSKFMIAYFGSFILLAICGAYAMQGKSEKIGEIKPMLRHLFVSDMTYYDLPRMTISMGGEGGGVQAPRIRMDIALEVAGRDKARVIGFEPRMMDRLTQYFNNLRPDQLQGPDALPVLREEMLKQVNSVGAPVPVHDLLFRQFVVM